MENGEMNTTFLINGGAGRVISAIPALEKFARLNPDDDFRVLVFGWESLFWSHPLLQKRTFSANGKGVFDAYIRDNRLICPEPYFVSGYYQQKLTMVEAFDEHINSTLDHGDLMPPKLYLSTFEQVSIKRIIDELKKQHNRSKLIVYQPFGSSAVKNANTVFDKSERSLYHDQYYKLSDKLGKDCLVIYFGLRDLKHPNDKSTVFLEQFNPDLRMYMALIKECDYFIGCDSVGQHIARAFDRPGTVIMGSTLEKNVTYPDYFRILRKADRTPVYDPIRINQVDSEFTQRENDGIMNFTDKEIETFAATIMQDVYTE